MKRRLAWFFSSTFLLGILSAPFAYSTDTPLNELNVDTDDDIEMAAWPSEMNNFLRQSTDWAANAIFDGLSDVQLFSQGVGRMDLGVKVGRKIYDNHDAAGTWSVADHFRIAAHYPVFNNGTQITAGFGLNFGLGTDAGLEIINIRQSRSGALKQLLADYQTKAKSAKEWYDKTELKAPAASSGTAAAPNESGLNEVIYTSDTPKDAKDEGSNWLSSDSMRKAQFAKLWNLLTFPARLPFRADWLSRLEEGEIMSYNVSGAVELSANVGWNLDPTATTLITQAGLSAVTFIRGDYRIAILKENERYVRVKLTRSYGAGWGYGAGSSMTRNGVLEGVLIAGARIGKTDLTLIPFQVGVTQAQARAFDCGYRYDLQDPAAREAYEKAVLGRFAASEDLATAPGSATVQKIYQRASREESKDSNHQISLTFLFKQTSGSTVNISDARINFPEGNYKVLHVSTENRSKLTTLWGNNEEFTYKYTTFLDKDGYAQGKDHSFEVMAEGFMEDRQTSGDEIYRYIDQVESIIGKHDLFPRLPRERPSTSQEQAIPFQTLLMGGDVYYGRSSFYFRLSLGETMIRKFLSLSEAERWSAIERAFGIRQGAWARFMAGKWTLGGDSPSSSSAQGQSGSTSTASIPLLPDFSTLGVSDMDTPLRLMEATYFENQWGKLSSKSDVEEIARGIGKLFANRTYAYEFMRVLRIALASEKLPYIISATNSSFGRIWREEDTLPSSGTVFDRVERELDFDHPWNHPTIDGSALVSDLTITPISEKKVVIRFNSSIKPTLLYIRLDESAFFNNPTRAELVVDNRTGRFQEGLNEIVLDAAATGFEGKLMRLIEVGTQYRFSIASSRDGLNWGPRVDAKFKIKVNQFKTAMTAAPAPAN